jgi:two-component system NtrC family sensor kinase
MPKKSTILKVCIFFMLLSSPATAEQPGDSTFAVIFRHRQSREYVPDIRDAAGVAFRDINGDELPDLYIVCVRGDNHLLLNSGAYRPFKDATALSGLDGNPRPRGYYNVETGTNIYDQKFGTNISDLDNDGDGDILIAGWGIATALYHNTGNLQFRNITDQLELFPPINANQFYTADIDNDGLLDLLLTDEYHGVRLLRNLGENYFQNITSGSGLDTVSSARSAVFCDFDNDGDADLYLTRYNRPDQMYRNSGKGHFNLVPVFLAVLQQNLPTTGVSCGDIDNDADMDFLVTAADGRNRLYLNQTAPGDSNWIFTEFNSLTDGKYLFPAYGSIMADFNNDGLLDIFIANSGPNELLWQRSLLLFERSFEYSPAKHPPPPASSRGAVCADFDLDGDLDVFVTNLDTFCVLYQNMTNTSSFIKFKLIGTVSNFDAVGARIELHRPANDKEIIAVREINGGAGYLSANEPLVHFGLDTLSRVDATIRFPGGRISKVQGLAAGQVYQIYEYGLLERSFIQFYQHVLSLMRQTVFWYQVILALLFFILIFVFVRLGLKRYRWSPGAASGYLVGFFISALIAITALKKLGLLTIYITIDILTILFIIISIINSERLYRLRSIRERYRSILIDLSNQIVNIHDNDELFRTVIENILQITEFNTIVIMALDRSEKNVENIISRGIEVKPQDPGTQQCWPEFLPAMRAHKHIQKNFHRNYVPLFNLLGAEVILSIERGTRIYGLLSLGARHPISPLKREDLELFKSLCNQMAVALENNEYIHRSTEMIKRLTAAEVQEKYLKELESAYTVLDSKNRDLQRLYDELKNTQAQLIQAEKMASLGQLVAGISHEMNNPVGFIYSNVKQLQQYTQKIENFIARQLSKPATSSSADRSRQNEADKIKQILPDIKNLIEDTITGSKMIKELVSDLRSFSHLDQAKWQLFNIHEGLENSIKIMLTQFKHQLTIQRSFQAAGVLECNPGQLNQVFLNLLTNAAQAIKDEGTIWIETEDLRRRQPQRLLVIRIRDNGTGMSAETVNKIFDPFFTTKDVGEGTGLGLSISYSIIKNHGGTIEVASSPGKGSTFTITLPYKKDAQIGA